MTDVTALAPRAIPGGAAAVLASIPKPNMLRIKVITIGDEGVGKSCIIKRYCEERFIPKYICTIGIDYGVKRVLVDGRETRVNFWDLAGGNEFAEIRNEFYKDAQGMLLVFDVTNARSFAQLEMWCKESVKCGAKDVVTIVCANKVDLAKQRIISEAEGRKWATSKGFGYYDVSASSGLNVASMFEQLFNDIVMLRRL
jgi:DnaJ homolog subfamily C member 27